MTRLRPDLQQTFRWSVAMPAEELDLLARLHPMSGINTAIIVYGLEELLKRIETRPDFCTAIREAVMRDRDQHANTAAMKQFCVRVPIELATRYTAIIPEMGGVAWLMRQLVQLYIDKAPPLADQIRTNIDLLLEATKPAPSTSFRSDSDD